jgi:hypothetical protein
VASTVLRRGAPENGAPYPTPCITDDVTMREDAQRLRSGTSPQVMAAIRNTAVAALRLAGFAAHRIRAALGSTKPRPATRRLESHITRMTTALGIMGPDVRQPTMLHIP